MIKKSAILCFILGVCCLPLEATTGILCEGEFLGSKDESLTLHRVTAYLEKKKPNAKLNEREIIRPTYQYNLETVKETDYFPFSYVIMDHERHFTPLEEFAFYNTFEFRENALSYRVHGIIYPTTNGSTKVSDDLYESTVLKLSMIIKNLLLTYTEVYRLHKLRDLNFGKNTLENLKEKTLLSDEDVHEAKTSLISLLDDLRTRKEENITDIKKLTSEFGVDYVETLIGGRGIPAEKHYVKYLKKCYALMNLFSVFFGKENISSYRIPENNFTFKVNKRKVLILDFNPKKKKAKEVELLNVGSTKQRKTGHDTIRHSNLILRDHDNRIVELNQEDIMIYSNSESHHLMIMIDIEKLKERNVRELTIEKHNFTKDIQDELQY